MVFLVSTQLLQAIQQGRGEVEGTQPPSSRPSSPAHLLLTPLLHGEEGMLAEWMASLGRGAGI